GANVDLSRILIGMTDYYSAMDEKSFEVRADFAVNGVAAGQNLASRFRPVSQGVWELRLAQPIRTLKQGTLVVSARGRQGNITRIERSVSAARERVSAAGLRPA